MESTTVKVSKETARKLAVARKSDGKVLTGDEHFKGLPETLWKGAD